MSKEPRYKREKAGRYTAFVGKEKVADISHSKRYGVWELFPTKGGAFGLPTLRQAKSFLRELLGLPRGRN